MSRQQLGTLPSRRGDSEVYRGFITPEQFGAAGNGTTNDQVALLAMIASLKPGDLVLLAGQYRHGGILPLNTKWTTWFCTGELFATDRQNAAIQLGPNAQGTKMYGVVNTVDAWDQTGNARGGTDIYTAPITAYDTSDIVLEDCGTANSAQCGMYFSTVHNYKIIRPRVDRSYADGIHQTHNCEDGLVVNPVVVRPGDDGVAVVSYLTRGTGGAAVDPCRRITIIHPVVKFCHARGVSVVGGTDIDYIDVDIFHTRAAGAMIASESGYNTHPAINCWVKGGTVRHVGYAVAPNEIAAADSPLDHGPLFLLSQQAAAPIVNCGFMDVEVSDVGPNVFQYLRAVSNNGATFTNCAYRRNIVSTGFEARAGVSLMGTMSGITFEGNIDNRAVLGQPRIASDVANTTTSTNNTGIGWSNVQPGTYEFEIRGWYTTATTSVGIQFNFGFSGTQSLFLATYEIPVSSTGLTRGTQTSTNGLQGTGTTGPGGTIQPFTIRGTIVVTAAVVLDFKHASTVSGSAATVKAGSFGRLTRIA